MSWLRNFVFTRNNYTDEHIQQFHDLPASYKIFGREVGESGTPHLQGYVELEKPMRFLTLKKRLPGFWIQKREGSPLQASDYCCKEDANPVIVGVISQQGKRTDIERLRDAIEFGVTNPKILREKFSAAIRYPQAMQQLLLDNREPRATPDIVLRPWQSTLFDDLKLPPPDRIITFVVDLTGNGGKTTFCDYIESLLPNVQVIKPSRYQDMAFELMEATTILLIDCPRARGECFRYDFPEDVKDGRVTCSKYQSFQKRLAPCHVVCFMNEHPDMTKLSLDRFKIIEIK